jgi:molybdopterin-guanine dinucleotide biosynthesis protein A
MVTSVVILAGGSSKRLGLNKSLLPIGGQPIIARIAGSLATLSDDLVVVTNHPQQYAALALPARLVPDEEPGAGSLMGIYSGLRAARHPRTLAVACDMPFLNLPLLRYMLSLAGDYDVVIPRLGSFTEPLHAFYNKACLPHMRALLDQNRRQIITFLGQVRVRYVDEDEIDRFDPQHRSFLNINTPEDWEHVQALLVEQGL